MRRAALVLVGLAALAGALVWWRRRAARGTVTGAVARGFVVPRLF